MRSQTFTFVLIAIVAMVSSIVQASVVAHRESTDRSPAEDFLSAVTISFGSEHIGSGVILNKQWIITSARCVENYNASKQLHVQYGSHNRNGGDQIQVEQIVIHPQYKQQRLVKNVALIKVKHDIELSSTVQAATLPTTETDEDELAYAIGWEKFNKSNQTNITDTLKYYQTTVMALDLCWERLEDLDAVKVNDDVICTYGPAKDSVIDLDHGSALVSMDKNELIGIGSWSENGYPTVYARVRSNLPWVETVIAL